MLVVGGAEHGGAACGAEGRDQADRGLRSGERQAGGVGGGGVGGASGAGAGVGVLLAREIAEGGKRRRGKGIGLAVDAGREVDPVLGPPAEARDRRAQVAAVVAHSMLPPFCAGP